VTEEMLTVLSVNVGLPRPLGVLHGEPVISGIAKQPVRAQSVIVRFENIEGDGQAALSIHGGPDKAVYAYPSDHWGWWRQNHGLACEPATFGENLTLRGATESDVAIGDRFRWGEVLMEISEPRAPCFKFAMHTGDEQAPQHMILAARCGWYARVLEEGHAPTHGAMKRVHKSDSPTVRDAFIAAMHPSSRELCLRVHDAPALAEAWRRTLAKKLAKMAS